MSYCTLTSIKYKLTHNTESLYIVYNRYIQTTLKNKSFQPCTLHNFLSSEAFIKINMYLYVNVRVLGPINTLLSTRITAKQTNPKTLFILIFIGIAFEVKTLLHVSCHSTENLYIFSFWKPRLAGLVFWRHCKYLLII